MEKELESLSSITPIQAKTNPGKKGIKNRRRRLRRVPLRGYISDLH